MTPIPYNISKSQNFMYDENGDEMETTIMHGKKLNQSSSYDEHQEPRGSLHGGDAFLNALPRISDMKGNLGSNSKIFTPANPTAEMSSATTQFKTLPVSMSIRSPRSVFEPVQSLPQYLAKTIERRDDLLQPYFRESNDHGNRIQAEHYVEKTVFPPISLKDRPLEHQFKPIVMDNYLPLNTSAGVQNATLFPQGQDDNDHDFLFPQVEVNALSSRARRRNRVPFTYIIIRDDDSTCTDVSAISYDSFEFEMNEFDPNPVKDHREINVETNYAILRKTKELMDRISSHNLGSDTDGQTRRNHDTNLDEPTLGIFSLQRVGILDKENILEETGRLLNQMEELPLPGDIIALMDEDKTQQLESKSQVKNDKELQTKERRPSIIEEMDLAFSDGEQPKKDDSLQKSENDPLDIDALIQDDDLSFDDLRDDTENQNDENGEVNRESISRDECFEKEQYTMSNCNNRKDCDTKELQSLPRITRNFDGATNVVRDESFARLGQEQVFRQISLLDDEISENGGIANIILELERKQSSLNPFDVQRQRSDSPPLKEIYIPVNYDTALGSFDLTTASSSFYKSSKRKHRVQSKRHNDQRIQSIIKKGRDNFFSRLGRKD